MRRFELTAVLVLGVGLLVGCASRGAYNRAQAFARAQDWDNAVIYYQKAVLEEPERIEYRKALDNARVKASQRHLELAKAWSNAGVLPRAEVEYRLALQLDPTNQFAADSLAALIERREAERKAREGEPGPSELEQLKQETGFSGMPLLHPASDQPLSLNFPPNTKVREIYQALGKAAGINVLFDSGITDRETFSIDVAGVSFQKALDQVALANKQFYKVIDEKTIFVAPDSPQKRREFEDQVIKTFYLSNAAPPDIVNIIRGVVEARRLVPNVALNAITVRDTPGKLAVIERIIRANDKPPAEVVIDVEILEVNRAETLDYGSTLSSFSITQGLDQPDTITTSTGPLTGLRLSSIPYINRSDWLITIPDIIYRLEKSKGNIRSLARPSLRALDGKQVTLRLGDQVPIETSTFVGGAGTSNVARNFQFRDIGTNIDITPRVHHNNEVTLQLQIEVTSAGSDPDGSGPVPPTFGNRRVNTEIRLKDGETNLLAGLFNSQDSQSLSGLPGIIDLPILKHIFGANKREHRETDIILTLTPHIVRTPNIRRADLEAFYVGPENDLGRGLTPTAFAKPPGGGSPFTPRVSGTPSGAATSAPGAAATPPTTPSTAPPPTAPAAIPTPRTAAPPPGPAGGAAGAAAAAAQAAPAVVSWKPSSLTVPVGQAFQMDVIIESASNVGHTPFWITFNKEFIEIVGVDEGEFMGQDGSPTMFMYAPMRDALVIGMSRKGRVPGVSGGGRLITVRMMAKAPGTTALGFTNNNVRDASNKRVPHTFVPGSVTVVP